MPGRDRFEAPASQLSVRVAHLRIEGAFPDMAETGEALKTAVEGKRLTVTEIFKLAQHLEEAYARAGYVLARVVVPPQTLHNDCTLRFVVVDGFIETVDVTAVPEHMRAVVLSYTESLAGRPHITLQEIERALLIAGDIAGLALKSALARGSREGGALLILEGRHQPVTVVLGLDNTLPASLGSWNRSASVSFNSPSGHGEQIYASTALGDPLTDLPDLASPLRLFGGGAILPVGRDGWLVNPEYTRSLTRPFVGDDGIAEHGLFERILVRTSYPLIRTRSRSLLIDGAVAHITQRMDAPEFATRLSEDRYTVFRIGGSLGEHLSGGASLRVAGHISRGIGGRSPHEAASSGIPLSRQEAEPVFTKIDAIVQLMWPLPDGVQLEIIGKGQLSFADALLRPEQFALDGRDAVATLPDDPLTVDEGMTVRAELSRAIGLEGSSGTMILVPYVFGAAGWGRLNAPTVLEASMLSTASVGAGLRSVRERDDGSGIVLTIEIARRFSDDAENSDGWHAGVSTNIQF